MVVRLLLVSGRSRRRSRGLLHTPYNHDVGHGKEQLGASMKIVYVGQGCLVHNFADNSSRDSGNDKEKYELKSKVGDVGDAVGAETQEV